MPRVRLVERPLIVAILLAFALWVLLQILSRTLDVLVVFLLALILAVAMMPIVSLLRRPRLPPRGWRIPRIVAVLLIYVVGGGFLAGIAYVIGSALFNEVSSLIEALPQIEADLGRLIDQARSSPGISAIVPPTSEVTSQLGNLGGAILDAARTFFLNLADIALRLGFVLILALFLVGEADQILAFWASLFPSVQREDVRRETTLVGSQVSRWVLGQLLIAAINGVLAVIIAFILGLPYPVLIGVVTAVLDFTPIVGPSIMAVPVFFLGLSQSLLLGTVAAVAFLALAEFEAHVLQPIVIGRAVRISPVLILVAIPFGLALYGPMGALLAVPVAASLQVLVRDLVLPRLWRREESRNGKSNE